MSLRDKLDGDAMLEILGELDVKDLVSMRTSDKGSRAAVDMEIKRRHTKAFGRIDKPIALMVNDLLLGSLDKKLQPIPHDIFNRGLQYGLSSILHPTFTMNNGNAYELETQWWNILSGHEHKEKHVALYRHAYVDELLAHFPEYEDSILTGYYRFLFLLNERSQDPECKKIYEHHLRSAEGQRYINKPPNVELWRKLLENIREPNNVLDRIQRLHVHRINLDEFIPEYGLVGALTDVDERNAIKGLIKTEEGISDADKYTLLQYYTYRCKQVGLNPKTNWLYDNKERLQPFIEQLIQQTLDEDKYVIENKMITDQRVNYLKTFIKDSLDMLKTVEEERGPLRDRGFPKRGLE